MSVRRFWSGLVWGALLIATSSTGWATPLVVSELAESTPATTTTESHDLAWWNTYGGLGTETPSIYTASSTSLSDIDGTSLVSLPTLVSDESLIQLSGLASLGDAPAPGPAAVESVDPLVLSLSEVPEPATLGLLLSGFAAVTFLGVRTLRGRRAAA